MGNTLRVYNFLYFGFTELFDLCEHRLKFNVVTNM